MSLDFSFENVKGDRSLWIADPEDEKSDWTWQAKSLPYLSLAIGMGEITEANHMEFYKRVVIWQKVVSPIYSDGEGNPLHITYDDVKNFIGFRTNVFPKLSRTFFMKKIEDCIEDDIKRELKVS